MLRLRHDLGFDVKATTTISRFAVACDGLIVHPVQNLGVFIDVDLVLRSHISAITQCCPAPSAAHQLDVITFDVADSGCRVSLIMTGLREQCSDWSTACLAKCVPPVRIRLI